MREFSLRWCWVLLVVALLGCSNYRSLRLAQEAEQTGDWDQAVLEYLELVSAHPSDIRYRAGLLRAKIQASHLHFEKAKRYLESGLLAQAMGELQQAVQLDPTNQYAFAELAKVREELASRRDGNRPENIEELKKKTRESAAGQPPRLDPRSKEPISLDFPEEVDVKRIYQALAKAFGLNILFDPQLRDSKIAISLTDVTAQDALEILMRTAGHFYKVIDEHTLFVVADSPQNRRKYEDLIIQTFFLSNAQVRDVMTILRSLIDARKIAPNESLNAIILRDTADKVKVAERIILANDKAKAEVVVEVELLQINTNRLQDLGMSLSDYSVGLGLDSGGQNNPLRLSDVEFLNQSNWILTVPSFLFTFIKNATEAQTLARPQLRISEGESARLNIGDRVPIPVTSFNTANTVGSNIVPVTSFQYQDVGITIDIEPRVHHNEEVSLKVDVEVSNISGNIGDQPIIGTRNITTTIRLQDGETNFLAGLLRTDEITSEDSVPGLGDIPILGRLFSKKRQENQRTDLVLTLTPHIIRRADITEEDLQPIWVGPEANIQFRGGTGIQSPVEGPFDEEARTPEAVQEQLRRRLQRLPPGLQGQVEEDAEAEDPLPSGIDLVPAPEPRRPPIQRRPDRTQEQEEENLSRLEVGPAEGVDSERQPAVPSLLDFGEAAPILAALEAQGTSLTPPVELTLSPPRLSVSPEQLFEVRLEVRAREPLSHLPCVVEFDPKKVELVQVRQGTFLGAQGQSEVLSDASKPGQLVLGASRLGKRPGVAGRGTVAYLTFRALTPGTASIGFERSEALGVDLEQLGPVKTSEATVVIYNGERPGPLTPRPVPGEA